MCLLIDLANRGITGHSAGRARDASLVLGAFATLDFPLTEVEVFHTDRGGGCFASMFVRQVRQCFSVVWADGFPRCRHRFPVM